MKPNRLISTILAIALCLSGASQQAQAQQTASALSKTDSSDDPVSRVNSSSLLARVWRGRRPGFSLMPSSSYASMTAVAAASSNSAVHGDGTVGKISMWIGTRPNGNSTLGDSIITQLNGNIGVGLATPTSKLTVQGMIETTLGGYKFPDGTVQTTAAVSGLQSVTHDATLTGDGTTGSPLGVAVPLNLIGAIPFPGAILEVVNTGDGGRGAGVFGGNAGAGMVGGTALDALGGAGLLSGATGGIGMHATGGRSNDSGGGRGLVARGGFSSSGLGGGGLEAYGGGTGFGAGGNAVKAVGADSRGFGGGDGVRTMGGKSEDNIGGFGVDASGGDSVGGTGGTGVRAQAGNSRVGAGGSGVEAEGGDSDHGAGNGVVATGGNGPFVSGFGNGVVATGGTQNSKGVVATGGIGSVGYGVDAMGGNSTGPGGVAGAGIKTTGGASSGSNSASGTGILAIAGEATNGATRGRAGIFEGEVSVSDHLTAGSLDVTGTKNFKIDHPLDPENKYLLHAAIESSEVLNVYSGNTVTDAKGEAVIILPVWFEALNRDVRYQLTVIATFAQAIVAEKVKHNRFTIRTNAPSVEVSWQVTGVRSDAVMRKHPFKPEEDKPKAERGSYLTPELFGKSEERGVEWARYPEIMQQLKQQRTETGQMAKRQPDQR